MFDSRNKRKPNPGHGVAARRARLHADNRVKPDDVRTVDIKESTGQIFVMPYNAQHIGARDEQQDYFSYSDLMDGETIAKYGSAAVLADGMGGMGNGAEASSAGVSEFLGAYAEYIDSGSSIEEALMFALDSANERVNTLGGAGSTLIGIVIKDNLLHWVSVGDSRLYLMRNGVMRQLNKEHVYSEILDERYSNGEISYEEAMNDPERYALTSYLGIPEIETVDRNRRLSAVYRRLHHDVQRRALQGNERRGDSGRAWGRGRQSRSRRGRRGFVKAKPDPGQCNGPCFENNIKLKYGGS